MNHRILTNRQFVIVDTRKSVTIRMIGLVYKTITHQ